MLEEADRKILYGRLVPGVLAVAAAVAVLGACPMRAAAASCPDNFAQKCKCPVDCAVNDSCEKICILSVCLETGGIYRCTKCSCDTVIGPSRNSLERVVGAALSSFASVARAAEPSQGATREFSNGHGEFVVLDRTAMGRIGASSAGVGLVLAVNKGRVTISGIVEGGPAAGAGLASGDELISIDARKVSGKTASQISARLRGGDGTLVILRIKSKKTGKTTKVSLIRSEAALAGAARSQIGEDVSIKSYELSALGASDCPKEKGACRFLYQDGGTCRYTCPAPSKSE